MIVVLLLEAFYVGYTKKCPEGSGGAWKVSGGVQLLTRTIP